MYEKENQIIEICGTTRLPCCRCQPVCGHRITKEEVKYKQIIIARKDLQMTPGKLSAQVAHGSMAFLTNDIRSHTRRYLDNAYPAWSVIGEEPQHYRRDDLDNWAKEARERGDNYFYCRPVNPKNPYGRLELCDASYHYETRMTIDNGVYENWIGGQFAKTVLEAKNKNHLLKAKIMAENLGMKEGVDFVLIFDSCRTELIPEFKDENGIGRTLTCIGFKPMPCETIDKIGKKYQLYK